MEFTSTKLMLFGLLILGIFSTAYGASDDHDDYNMQGDDDYQYDDEKVSHDPKPTSSVQKSTEPPFFDVEKYTKHVRPGENAILDCSVHNLAETNVIMWMNETEVLSQSLKAVSERVSVSKNYTLTIFNTTKFDTHSYFCVVLPQNLKLRAQLHVSDQHNHPPEGQQSHSQKHDQSADSAGDRIDFVSTTFLLSLTVGLITVDKFLRI